MRPPIIRKNPATFPVAPNLPDADAARAAFSWASMRLELAGLPGGALNIAHEAVDRHASEGLGGKVAIRWLPREGAARDITYDELRRLTNRFANVLRALGIAKGERLFVLTGRIPELYVGVLGALKAGVVVCPLFSAFGPDPVRMRLDL
jgi:acetyl-CoA synthetase